MKSWAQKAPLALEQVDALVWGTLRPWAAASVVPQPPQCGEGRWGAGDFLPATSVCTEPSQLPEPRGYLKSWISLLEGEGECFTSWAAACGRVRAVTWVLQGLGIAAACLLHSPNISLLRASCFVISSSQLHLQVLQFETNAVVLLAWCRCRAEPVQPG